MPSGRRHHRYPPVCPFIVSLSFFLILIQSPQHSMSLVDSYILFTSEQQNTWRAGCAHAVFDWFRNTPHMKLRFGPTSDMFAKWTTNAGLSPTIEALLDGVDLL